MADDDQELVKLGAVVSSIHAEIEKASPSRRQRIYEAIALAALSSIPWIGGVFAASVNYRMREGDVARDTLIEQWLKEHEDKLLLLRQTLEEMATRLESLGDEIDERIQSEQYLVLLRKAFREWDEADTAEKRLLLVHLITNATGTRICSDDILRLFLDWVDTYHESHFAVIRKIYEMRNDPPTRYDIWVAVYGETLPRDDSADYDGSGTQDLAYTDQNQDTEKTGWSTNLYDFMFREYRTAHGRWASPDPSGLSAVDPSNPQSWNRYAYVVNNPMSLLDPLGLHYECGFTVVSTSISVGSTVRGYCDWVDDCHGSGLSASSSPGYSPQNCLAQPSFTFNVSGQGAIAASGGGAANNGSRTPKICGGTFEFAGMEADLAEGGAFSGAIHEQDSIDGHSAGNLTEGWGGGEVVAAGGGKITTTDDKSIFQGFLGFVGVGASAGPLAGIQIGYASGKGWGGLYVEGHLGIWAWGGGGYLRTSCKAGG